MCQFMGFRKPKSDVLREFELVWSVLEARKLPSRAGNELIASWVVDRFPTCVCRRELQLLALEKKQLEETAAGLRARCSDMEGQCVQHGRLHQRMKTRQEKTRAAHVHTLESGPGLTPRLNRIEQNRIHPKLVEICLMAVIISCKEMENSIN